MSSMSSGSRGRSLVRKVTGGRKRSRSARSGSTAQYSSLSNRQDGITRRGMPYGQSYSMYFDPFPRVMHAILRYTTVIDFNPTTGLPQKHFFRAGSINDPDYTGVGYQPYGHDNYQELFNHYRVVKSVAKITNTTYGQGAIMGLAIHDDVAVTNDYDQIRTIKTTKFLPLGTSGQPASLAMTYNSAAFFPGQTQNTTALFGNNPAEEQYFMVFVEGSSSLVNPGLVSVHVAIDYYVEMSELKQLFKS